MKTLILTEKPSVARDFAKALNAPTKSTGCLQGKDYTITWALGHLVELMEPEQYDERWARWDMETLPIIPDEFRYVPIKKTASQLDVIHRLIAGGGFDRVVIATDAGREGEVIARTVLNATEMPDQTELMRFWTSQALTPEVINEEMARLKPAADYDRLWHAGQTRQTADWLVGMNGSRAASLKMRDLFSVGRVQTAVLALIVDRQRERDNFTPRPYWQLRARFTGAEGSWWGTWFDDENTRIDTRQQADALVASLTGRPGHITSVKKRTKTQVPPPLFSLTELQRDANSKYGLSAQNTLDIAQELYETRKCLSYPRTDSQVLGTKNVDMIKTLVGRLSAVYPPLFAGMDRSLIDLKNKRVFNDAKLTDHHALIPMAPLPENAGEDEKKIYGLVMRRFAAAFHPDCRYEQSEIITGITDEAGVEQRFRTRGRVITEPGWQSILKPEKNGEKKDDEENAELPPVQKGQECAVSETELPEKHTPAPQRYTEALLLKDMSNPAKYVEEAQLKKIYRGDVGLGTQATRAQSIETLLARNYVVREKKYLVPTPKGCHLIDTLRRFPVSATLASPEKTALWEMQLNAIAQGEDSAREFIGEIRDFIRQTVDEFRSGSVPVFAEDALGVCPACGGMVSEGPKGYGCGNWREEDGGCRFVIWKTIAGREIDAETARELLAKGRTPVLDGFTSRKNTTFSTALKLAEEDGQFKVTFDFGPRDTAPRRPIYGPCPLCGGDVIAGRKAYGCSNYRPEKGGCRFVLTPDIHGQHLSEEDIRTLLSGACTTPRPLTDENGTTADAALRLVVEDGAWEVRPEPAKP